MDIQGDYSFGVTIPFTSDVDTGKYVGHAASLKDQHLVLAAQSGCRIAFSELWDLYSRRVYRTLLRITHNPHDAEDAMQDAFLSAFLALERFEGRSHFYSWLTRIAINSALGILRKRRCHPETSLGTNSQLADESPQEEFIDLSLDPEEIYAEQEEHEKLMQAIQRLPPKLRNATLARITDNCSMKELARRLNISEAAAKSRLARARAMLGSLSTPRYARKIEISAL